MYRKLCFSIFIGLLLGLSTPACAINFDTTLLASYEPSEINDLTVVVRPEKDPTLDVNWPLLGGVNDVPPATEGNYVLRMKWTGEADRKVEIGHYWTYTRFGLAGEDFLHVDVYFATDLALPKIIGIWDDVFGWVSAVYVPDATNNWHTVSFYVGNLEHTGLDHIFALLFEQLAGDYGTIYIDNLRLGPIEDRLRKIGFSGYNWSVLQSEWPIGVGPNLFTDDPNVVWVDPRGHLHLSIVYKDPNWYCSEVIANANLGYGTYVFTIKGRVDLLDPNIVLGLFIYDVPDQQGNPREIDFELSRWWDPNEPNNAQYVVQPWYHPNNIHRFYIDEHRTTTHEVTWTPDKICFQSYYRHYPLVDPNNLIESWCYTGADIPKAGEENSRINFWLLPPKGSPPGTPGGPPSDGKEAEIVIKNFRYLPMPGDLDNDNDVDFADFALFAANWLAGVE